MQPTWNILCMYVSVYRLWSNIRKTSRTNITFIKKKDWTETASNIKTTKMQPVSLTNFKTNFAYIKKSSIENFFLEQKSIFSHNNNTFLTNDGAEFQQYWAAGRANKNILRQDWVFFIIKMASVDIELHISNHFGRMCN